MKTARAPWTQPVAPEAAGGDLAKIYQRIPAASSRGAVSALWQSCGHHPPRLVALTCEPSERKLEDIERLREYGFDDAAIVKATEIAAYYNLTNRIACALGVPLEPGLEPWEFGSQR